MKLLVGSKNRVKIEAAKEAFEEYPVEEEWHKGRVENVLREDNEELVTQWLEDIKSVDNGSYPQGRLVLVAERGTKEMALSIQEKSK